MEIKKIDRTDEMGNNGTYEERKNYDNVWGGILVKNDFALIYIF